ncbi:MAG: LysM domain-containing protein [Verrucomicrobiota bacterium]
MSAWTFLKLLAAAAVLGAIAFTGMLAYHVAVRPRGGVFEKIIPHPSGITGGAPDVDFAKMVDAAEMPDIDPGEKAFQKAHELIALGQLPAAREKLTTIVNVFPTSSSAPIARHIVGEMNLDEIFSAAAGAGKQTHLVKRGDSYLSIAAQHKTTLDLIINLNGMQELKNLQPGEELMVMPLEFSLLIEPQKKSLSLWDGARFICEFPIVHLNAAGKLANLRTTINSKSGQIDGRRPKPETTPKAKSGTKANAKASAKPATKADPKADAKPDAKGVAPGGKAIQLAKLPLQIRAYAADDTGARGIFLSAADIEELFLLTRVGNAVEIRNSAR